MTKEKHVLGISGGKDSAGLAVYMKTYHPEIDIEYFFTDTGKELPETYDFLTRLEGYLRKRINRLDSKRDFDFWLRQHGNYLPSATDRWCTIKMKLKPFEDWVQAFLDEGYTVYSYVAIRADEEFREGYQSKDSNLIIKLPLREHGIDKPRVMQLLNDAGLGLPEYYEWRSRSGCTFCFFQRKIEWVGLLERHPEAFQEAIEYEKSSIKDGYFFTWSENESLEELAKPERVAQIKAEYEKRKQQYQERQAKRRRNNLLQGANACSIDTDDVYGSAKVCLACHK